MINNQIYQFILSLMIIAFYFYTCIIEVMIRIYSDSNLIMGYA